MYTVREVGLDGVISLEILIYSPYGRKKNPLQLSGH